MGKIKMYKKSGKQAERRKQANAMESKWNPVLKHGDYNCTQVSDSIVRLKKKTVDSEGTRC